MASDLGDDASLLSGLAVSEPALSELGLSDSGVSSSVEGDFSFVSSGAVFLSVSSAVDFPPVSSWLEGDLSSVLSSLDGDFSLVSSSLDGDVWAASSDPDVWTDSSSLVGDVWTASSDAESPDEGELERVASELSGAIGSSVRVALALEVGVGDGSAFATTGATVNAPASAIVATPTSRRESDGTDTELLGQADW
ncbi:MAG: hypothetical protein L0H41_03460 [Microlunatus sp.]|nr:hypothetical protein [Microlunatus sp.]MDN5769880.1 hypothetical protein [Microlunatus sp.]